MRPTKQQLEKCVSEHKDEGFIATVFVRKISIHITKYLVRTSATPNQITFFSFLFGCFGALLVAWQHLIIGGVIIFFSYILDSVDGEVARLKGPYALTGKYSKAGPFLDATLDRVKEGVVFFCLSYALCIQAGTMVVWVIGFIAMFSVMMTNLVLTEAGKIGTLRSTHASLPFVAKLQKYGFKQSFLTLGIDAQMFIIMVGCVFNQLFLLLMFFAIVQNLYWLAIFTLIFKGAK